MDAMERFQKECSAFFDGLSLTGQRSLVFGDGQCSRPLLMLVGEAPGEQEALQGKPFVGKAGKNLDGFLQALRLERKDIYITNVVKVRPTQTSAAGRVVNRPPSREEKNLFTPWLMREAALVRPQALVTLGNVALQAFQPGQTIGQAHGVWRRAVVAPPREPAFTLPLFALYHPASVIYNGSLKQTYAQDLQALADSLHTADI